MMQIRDHIVEEHSQAENSVFFKSVMDKSITGAVWADFLFNKAIVLSVIEQRTMLVDELLRVNLLLIDIVSSGHNRLNIKKTTREYVDYLKTVDEKSIYAHIYVWYMGDLSGGKMIRKIVSHPTAHLDFKDPSYLKEQIISKVDDSLVPEIKTAFDWVIKLLTEFEKDILGEEPK